MTKKGKDKLTIKELVKRGVPYGIALGLITAHLLGWDAKALEGLKNYYDLKQVFPTSTSVVQVEDGDTVVIDNGLRLRLIGIDAPDRGSNGFEEAKKELQRLTSKKKVYLEYDRYQDDKFGRILAWVWIDCETTPQFLPANYMHKSGNESMPGLTENPKGCKNGRLVNEELVKKGFAKTVVYKDRGPTKYESRLGK